MPSTKRAAEAQPATSTKGHYTVGAIEKRAADRQAQRSAADAAVAWCRTQGKGAKAALATKKFAPATLMMVRNRLNEKVPKERDHAVQLMTNTEREKLAKWLLACGDGQDPKTRAQISVKVKEMLRARHKYNKKQGFGERCIKLNRVELIAVNSPKEEPRSCCFFAQYYPWCRGHGIAIEEGVDRAQDIQRAAKMHERTVDAHFHGEFGLAAELIRVGAMDPATKVLPSYRLPPRPLPVPRLASRLSPCSHLPPHTPPDLHPHRLQVIKDPRRLLNSDETPQPIDMPQRGSRHKVAKRQGQAVRRAGTVSKENVSVNMTWDLSGYNYGVQLVLKRKELTHAMVADPPDLAPGFDGEVDLWRMQTRSCLFSRTEGGMQTAESFLQHLEELDRQITARSDADVARGKEPIERPVVLTLDNHASRYGKEVLEAATGEAPRLGICLWTEEAGVSGFLQALDQYNSKFHRHYNLGVSALKIAHKAHFGEELPQLGLEQFMMVLGGDAVLGLPGMWFSWASPYDIVTAWRRVGITGNKLVPELIDRSEFIDQYAAVAEAEAEAEAATGPSSPLPPTLDQLAKTPPGVKSGTVTSERGKVQRLLERGRQLELQLQAQRDAPFDPEEAGLLVASVAKKPKSKSRKRARLSDKNGSMTMQGVREERDERDAEDEALAATRQAKKLLTLAKKEEATNEKAEMEVSFSRCEVSCHCGRRVETCRWAGFKRCPTCSEIKKGACRAKACVAARKPLLLTGPEPLYLTLRPPSEAGE